MRKERPREPREPGRGPPKKKEIDLGRWISRAEAARLAGVTVNTIINWQKDEKVQAVADYRRDRGGSERRQWVYNPMELIKLRRPEVAMRSREPGETAARAFELFRDGKSNADVVIALRETPDNVGTLREQWLDMGGSELVINPAMHQALEELVGPFTGVADLVELVAKLKRRDSLATTTP
jgi:hypothetical protein